MPRCLVIAPSRANLSALQTVLTELGITATATTELLVGAQLATVPLDRFTFAVALLPTFGPDDSPATTAAIFLEAGIALGRGLPLIVLAEDPDEDLPALGGVAGNVWTIVGAKDEASIRLHLTLFSKVLESGESTRGPSASPTAHAGLVVTPSFSATAAGSQGLQGEVLGLLQAAGAKVEAESVSSGDNRVDAVALVPGAERLGPVLIEVKSLNGHGLPAAVTQLTTFLGQSGAMFGLVVYDGPVQDPGPIRGFPIIALHVEQLRELVRGGTLGTTLVRTRNNAVHGSTR